MHLLSLSLSSNLISFSISSGWLAWPLRALQCIAVHGGAAVTYPYIPQKVFLTSNKIPYRDKKVTFHSFDLHAKESNWCFWTICQTLFLQWPWSLSNYIYVCPSSLIPLISCSRNVLHILFRTKIIRPKESSKARFLFRKFPNWTEDKVNLYHLSCLKQSASYYNTS